MPVELQKVGEGSVVPETTHASEVEWLSDVKCKTVSDAERDYLQ